MRALKTSDKYTPPRQPGFVFWSNYRHRESPAAHLWTPQQIAENVAVDFGVPLEDVLVVSFEPDGHGDDSAYYVTRWATFLAEKHRALVYLRNAHIKALFAELVSREERHG